VYHHVVHKCHCSVSKWFLTGTDSVYVVCLVSGVLGECCRQIVRNRDLL
jgi:hypothetical protein